MDSQSTDSVFERKQVVARALESFVGLGPLRVIAMVLVVMGHAAISYKERRSNSVFWVIYDLDSHWCFDLMAFCILGMAMPLFFCMAGLVTGLSLHKHGPKVFLIVRSKRLLVPFVVGVVTILPITYGIWSYGFQVGGLHNMTAGQRAVIDMGIGDSIDEWGPLHLWFLEYLFLLSVGYCVVHVIANRVGVSQAISRAVGWFMRTPFKAALLVFPTVGLLWIDLSGWYHIFPNFVPQPFVLLYFSLYFAVGIWISRLKDPRAALIPWSLPNLLLAVMSFGLGFWFAEKHFEARLVGIERLGMITSIACATWFSLFGLLGLFIRIKRAPNRLVLYMMEASFWIYLFHLPVLALFQIELSRFRMPLSYKFAIASTGALLFSLLTFHVLVKYTRLGKLINVKVSNNRQRRHVPPVVRRLLWVCLLLLVVRAGRHFEPVLFHQNFHTVVAESIYRSGRLTREQLEEALSRYDIATVVSLRGGDTSKSWYVEQQLVCDRRHVRLTSVSLNANDMPSRTTLKKLVRVLRSSPKPVLVQGHMGIRRAALAAAVAEVMIGVQPSSALDQFSSRYGYFHSYADRGLHAVVRDYDVWLHSQDQDHSPRRFMEWVNREYIADQYAAALEPIDMPRRMAPGKPQEFSVRATNHSPDTWRLSRQDGRGVRLAVSIRSMTPSRRFRKQVIFPTEDAFVAPGQSVVLSGVLPKLPRAGRYQITADLIYEDEVLFSEMGSTPLKRNVVVPNPRVARRSRTKQR